MSAPLRITERSAGGVIIFHLHGHLVFDEGDRLLRERVNEAVAAGSRFLIIDLREVSYVDSGGIGALVEMYNNVLRHGGQLKLLCPSACADRVLHVTHLSSVFEVFNDEDAAVSSMAAPVSHPIEH